MKGLYNMWLFIGCALLLLVGLLFFITGVILFVKSELDNIVAWKKTVYLWLGMVSIGVSSSLIIVSVTTIIKL